MVIPNRLSNIIKYLNQLKHTFPATSYNSSVHLRLAEEYVQGKSTSAIYHETKDV